MSGDKPESWQPVGRRFQQATGCDLPSGSDFEAMFDAHCAETTAMGEAEEQRELKAREEARAAVSPVEPENPPEDERCHGNRECADSHRARGGGTSGSSAATNDRRKRPRRR